MKNYLLILDDEYMNVNWPEEFRPTAILNGDGIHRSVRIMAYSDDLDDLFESYGGDPGLRTLNFLVDPNIQGIHNIEIMEGKTVIATGVINEIVDNK